MPRLRDLGFAIGTFPIGDRNAVTDVAGVSVGHHTVIRDEPRVARTGVTIVNTRPIDTRGADLCFGGLFSFNGNGEMTGSHWLDESGLLSAPIGITNTHQVGLVRDALVAAEVERRPHAQWHLPVVAETYDGFLNDIDAFHLTIDDVNAAIADADAHPDGIVPEGNVGGGTGMVCHEFKGGIDTSSRRVETAGFTYTVGALVQANYGARELLRLDGRPIGTAISAAVTPVPSDPTVAEAGSIIVIIATDAPLLADQCKRLARRATIGLARVGGTGSNGSGDIFIAFSTGNHVPFGAVLPTTVTTLPAGAMTPLFDATAEAVEESIWNALCAAETMTGHRGRIAHAIPHDRLVALR
ncbi:MAG: P1 family peptidase [Ilumatobacteraceae bacterium]